MTPAADSDAWRCVHRLSPSSPGSIVIHAMGPRRVSRAHPLSKVVFPHPAGAVTTVSRRTVATSSTVASLGRATSGAAGAGPTSLDARTGTAAPRRRSGIATSAYRISLSSADELAILPSVYRPSAVRPYQPLQSIRSQHRQTVVDF